MAIMLEWLDDIETEFNFERQLNKAIRSDLAALFLYQPVPFPLR